MTDFDPVRNLLPLYTTTKSNIVASHDEYVGNLWSVVMGPLRENDVIRKTGSTRHITLSPKKDQVTATLSFRPCYWG